jgi:hypothetical protein
MTMSDGQEYWQDWIGYWGYVQDSAADRWFKSAQKLRSADYKIEHLWSDVSGFWMDTAQASMAFWRGQVGGVQQVIFWLDCEDTYAGPKTVAGKPVPQQNVQLFAGRFPNTSPSYVWLGDIESGSHVAKAHSIDWKNFDVRLNDRKTAVEIRLIGLEDRKPLARATYRVIVHLDETPIAEVFIVVRQARAFGERSTHAAGHVAAVKRKKGGKPGKKKPAKP